MFVLPSFFIKKLNLKFSTNSLVFYFSFIIQHQLINTGFVLLPILLISTIWYMPIYFGKDQVAKAQSNLVYENRNSGLKISYPSDWSVNETNLLSDGTGYIEFLPLIESSSVRIGIGGTDEKFLPEIIAKITAQEISKTFKDFRLIDEGPLNINGRDAYEIYLTYRDPAKGMVTNEYIFIEANERIYAFSLQGTTTLGEYIRMFTSMLDMVYSAEFDRSVSENRSQSDILPINL